MASFYQPALSERSLVFLRVPIRQTRLYHRACVYSFGGYAPEHELCCPPGEICGLRDFVIECDALHFAFCCVCSWWRRKESQCVSAGATCNKLLCWICCFLYAGPEFVSQGNTDSPVPAMYEQSFSEPPLSAVLLAVTAFTFFPAVMFTSVKTSKMTMSHPRLGVWNLWPEYKDWRGTRRTLFQF